MAGQCSFRDSQLGDLVQFLENNKAYHSMILIGCIYDNWGASDPWAYKYDVKIAQNSTDASTRLYNVPLSSRIAKHPNSQQEYVQIVGCWS